jgi:ribosome-binding protein aMBF1 (putative translation factor)
MVSAAQIRAARALLGWSRAKLAAEVGVSVAEVAAIEDRAAIVEVLAEAGIEFAPEEPEGVRLRRTP